MPVDAVTEIEIARPREEVAAYAADPDNATEWYENIKAVEWRTEPPLAAGTRVEFTAEFLGRKLVYTYEVRELVPGERLVMRTQQGPFPMETTYTWADARRHAHDARQPRRAGGLRQDRCAGAGRRDPTGKPQGPAAVEGDPGGT